jgi:hypothetical protein
VSQDAVAAGNSGAIAKVATILAEPMSGWSCVLGWCIATAVFVGLVKQLGGPALNDTYQSVFSTWAIAHGQLTCAFPSGYRLIAPLYPLVSGGIAAAGHIGSAVPFPSASTMGQHCDRAFSAINVWSLHADALNRTVQIAYISWLFLMAGVILLLRATGRGRCGWEPTGLVVVAALPPVWMCIEDTFHPEDLIAIGLALAAVSCARRDAWVGAGVLIAFAYFSQQFAILVAAPLLIVAPGRRRIAFAGSAIGTALVLSIPLLALSSGGAAHALFLGTGTTGGIGGTVVWELGLHGGPLFVLSRLAPVALAVVLAWWSLRRLGASALEPTALVSVVAISLGLRLVFEQQLFGYYFMALAVTLVVLDVVRGHVRASLIGWLATVSMVYLLASTALDGVGSTTETILDDVVPLSVIGIAMLLFAYQVLRHDTNWMLVLWVGMIAAALVTWEETNVLGTPPAWFWQVVLVPLGLALAATPLLEEIRRHDGADRPSTSEQSAHSLSSPT